jgi:alanine dehydrogenase
LKIGIPKEIIDGETRVAVVPSMISVLIKNQHEIFVEKGAGFNASFLDTDYQNSGAIIIDDPIKLYKSIDILLKINPPYKHPIIFTYQTAI